MRSEELNELAISNFQLAITQSAPRWLLAGQPVKEKDWELLGTAGNFPDLSQNPPSALPESSQIYNAAEQTKTSRC